MNTCILFILVICYTLADVPHTYPHIPPITPRPMYAPRSITFEAGFNFYSNSKFEMRLERAQDQTRSLLVLGQRLTLFLGTIGYAIYVGALWWYASDLRSLAHETHFQHTAASKQGGLDGLSSSVAQCWASLLACCGPRRGASL